MKVESAAFLILSTCLLAACQSNGLQSPGVLSTGTAATSALSPSAYSTPLLSPSSLKPGRIYHQGSDGRLYEICADDFKKQRALSALSIVSDAPSPDVVEDRVALQGATFGFMGANVQIPYRNVRVTGFRVDRVDLPNPYDYIKQNLADTCKNETLGKNRPYYITSAVAIAQKAEVMTRGAVTEIKIGGAEYKEPPAAGPILTRTNVVFGVEALLVR